MQTGVSIYSIKSVKCLFKKGGVGIFNLKVFGVKRYNWKFDNYFTKDKSRHIVNILY